LKKTLEKWKLNTKKKAYFKQAEKWWFQPQDQEKKQLAEAGEIKQLQQVWQEISARRSFWGHLFFIAFCVLVFFGWDKFWAWYESPLTEEWGWDDDEEEEDDEDEKEIKKQADTKEKKEPAEENSAPKTMSDSELTKNRWGKVTNWLQNNKVRTVSLISLVISLPLLVVRIVRLAS
jgi:hypothetical protein